MTDVENIVENINKKTKEIISKIKNLIIELECEFKKNNELILKELKELLFKYKVTYKTVSLV